MPVEVVYRPVRHVAQLERMVVDITEQVRQGELSTWLGEARDIIGQWSDPRRLRAESDRDLLGRSLDFLAKVRICCRCGGVGEVPNLRFEGNPETTNVMIPVSWVCVVCRRYVCINCVLTIPGAVPVEIMDDTLCSALCQDKLTERQSLGEWDQ